MKEIRTIFKGYPHSFTFVKLDAGVTPMSKFSGNIL